ncbi:hypothetical protein NKI86_07055 [Mesorhizobium sp. M0320]|uniref:hypothetical protein n=1 Tax=Mesorhizobium sp. M0320 TaxID=2956936 RepID=UPI00333C89B0
MKRRARLAGLILLFLMVTQLPTLAADDKPVGLAESVYSTSLSALTILFVTAVVLESAFATIFNWRVFLSYFSSKGVKTIIMIVVSLLVVYAFKLDVIASLIAGFKLPQEIPGQTRDTLLAAEVANITGPTSMIITALVLAGGSAGVNNLMVALGFRSNRETEIAPQPRQDEAWVAVRVKRLNAVGQVQVVVSEIDPPPTGQSVPAAIAGTIGFSRPRIRDLLLRNVDRFPQNGGYVAKPNVPYSLVVEGKDAAGNSIKRLDDRYYAFAPRAIVDFEVEI